MTSFATDQGTRTTLSGNGSVPLASIVGRFVLPAESAAQAADSAFVGLTFERNGWLIRRSVDSRPDAGCGCGDRAPAWSGPTLAFVRATAETQNGETTNP